MKTKKKASIKKTKNTRKNIPDNIKLKVWNDSGGRCEFRGCNKPLWYNELTLSDANFGKLAHIIGASKDGPRGGSKSEDLQISPDNIMLLCQTCHDEIDNSQLSQLYPVKLLQEIKKEHETRIKTVTEIKNVSKTEILIFKANIDKRAVYISSDEAKRTIIAEKLYPNGKGYIIDLTFGAGDGDKNYWEYSTQQIEAKIKEDIKRKGISEDKIEHLSIFALAPIPLLIVLGKAISDTFVNKIGLYQRHRDTQDWHWKKTKETLPSIVVKRPTKCNPNNNVALVLSISDFINSDKFPDHLKENTDVYEITIDGTPSTHVLKVREQITKFEIHFRETLNEIQKLYGKDKETHVLPAIPAPLAIKVGLTLLPKKEMPLVIYDYNSEYNGLRKVLVV